ncbi:hypothetical protein OESDEN_05531 [Oesophagostomum dentatum]|uniref:Uncharacterized protein n=1 Tax=Oesophagostomum dentatum TaxID=61180 RepID=A0A0B1TGK8_OESDE|nr:hypothetical protein OESDEN_05531 [Oesophagostomum dentatum]
MQNVHVQQIRINGLVSAALAVGKRLELFKALAKVGRLDFFEELTSGFALLSHSLLPVSLKPFDKLCEVIKKDGPFGLDYSDFDKEFFEILANFSEPVYKEHLFTDLLPSLGPDVVVGASSFI